MMPSWWQQLSLWMRTAALVTLEEQHRAVGSTMKKQHRGGSSPAHPCHGLAHQSAVTGPSTSIPPWKDHWHLPAEEFILSTTIHVDAQTLLFPPYFNYCKKKKSMQNYQCSLCYKKRVLPPQITSKGLAQFCYVNQAFLILFSLVFQR